MGTTDRAVVRASLEEVLSATSYESRGERRGRSRDRDRDRIDRDWSRSQSRGAATTGEDEKRRIKANLRNRVVEGLTASRTRSLSREKVQQDECFQSCFFVIVIVLAGTIAKAKFG